MKRIALFFLAVIAALPLAGQTGTASLGGRIVDENGPLEGVTVVAIHQRTNAQYYATSDRGGWYQMLDVLPGGPYTVRFHYFSYKPLTVRDVFTYTGQNTVIDADVEAGIAEVHVDEAATSLRLGENLGGGTAVVSPVQGYDLIGQDIMTKVPFDVRLSADLDGFARQSVIQPGSNRFHLSAYDYYSGSNLAGLTVAAPLFSEDYQLFAGAQYDSRLGLGLAGRFDARFGPNNRLDVSGQRIPGQYSWANAGLVSQFADGAASNRLRAGWYDSGLGRGFSASDDFTWTRGPQRMLAGVYADASRFDFYVQDVVRAGRRITLQAGVRFSFPFTFSPRVSIRYDVLGTGALILRGGTAVYGVHGAPSAWKNLAAIDTRLPAGFMLTLEGVYAQSWERLFIISSRNTLDSRYAVTARLERTFADGIWALASYTRSDGAATDRVLAGFYYKTVYFGKFGTTAALLYNGCNVVDPLSPASLSWQNVLEARLSQDFGFTAAGRDHIIQLTAYYRRGIDRSDNFLAGICYML